jgi:hypothetical protein
MTKIPNLTPGRSTPWYALYNLRRLSSRARGDNYTQESFDGTIRFPSATVSQELFTISAHWTALSSASGDVFFYSYLLKCFAVQCISLSEWNEASRWIKNAIEFVVNLTETPIKADLKAIQDNVANPPRPKLLPLLRPSPIPVILPPHPIFILQKAVCRTSKVVLSPYDMDLLFC